MKNLKSAMRSLLLLSCVALLCSAASRSARAQDLSVNAGGGAAGTFLSDRNFVGGNTASTTSAINTSLVSTPVPPQAVFQTERWGASTYTFGGLTPGRSYTVRLYFAEFYWTAAGQRRFNVNINGTRVLTNFDILATAGGQFRATQQNFNATANGSGQVVIQFAVGTADQPKVSGITIVGAGGTPTPTPTPNPTPTPPGGQLIWSDEFSGTAINTTNWTFDTGGGGWGNNELENYTNRSVNARIENGNLVIEARRESLGGSAYTSARMKTQGLRTFGINTRVEARIDAPGGNPGGQGIWPAFWMLGSNITTAGWPACGEIDIMEMRGQNPFQNLGTMHWLDNNNTQASYGGTFSSGSDLSAGYHIYTVERTGTYIRWYVDGIQYHEGNISGGINGTQEFQNPFFIILNVAVGGNFVGSPDGSTVFPQQMRVDWVRVYQVP
jgi:beta-glucanase (GH16 family)